MKLFRIVWDAIRPGSPEFRAHLSLVTEEHARLATTLHRLEQPATREITAAADRAAEF